MCALSASYIYIQYKVGTSMCTNSKLSRTWFAGSFRAHTVVRNRNRTKWGLEAPLGPIFFIVIIYFIFIVSPLSKTLGPLLPISLASLIQIAIIQPKNLTKTIKTFTIVIVFQPKKKNYFTTKKQINHVLLEKLKLIFLQLQ